ncbi:MAG: hypothetical protein ACREL3_02135 [Gemmatimonadales bacterium]
MKEFSGGSRLLILVLVIGAAIIALAPVVLGHGRDVKLMREGLQSVLAECRAKYAIARNARDSAQADEWVPQQAAGVHPGDPACGRYRRRNMLSREG